MKLSRALLSTVGSDWWTIYSRKYHWNFSHEILSISLKVSGLLPDDFFDDVETSIAAKPAVEKNLTFKEKLNILSALENLSEKAKEAQSSDGDRSESFDFNFDWDRAIKNQKVGVCGNSSGNSEELTKAINHSYTNLRGDQENPEWYTKYTNLGREKSGFQLLLSV